MSYRLLSIPFPTIYYIKRQVPFVCPGNVMNCPENQIKKNNPGGGWKF